MPYRGKRQGSYASPTRDARSVHARRSDVAKLIYESLRSPRAKTEKQWLNQPNRYDVTGIDAPKSARKKSLSVSEANFWANAKNFNRLINKDDIEEKNDANQKIVKQIMNILEENNIPYCYGGKETGIQVLSEDMKKAEKLMNKFYIALKKTL